MVGLASAVAGVEAFAFLTLAQRSLGSEGLGPLVQLWAWWAVAFAAVSLPWQRFAVSVVVEGVRPAMTVALAGVLGLLAVGTLAVEVWGADALLRSEADRWLVFGALIPFLAAIAGLQRGVAAADGRLSRLAMQIGGENGLRVVAVVVLMQLGADPPWLGGAIIAGYLIYGPGLVGAVRRCAAARPTRVAASSFGRTTVLSLGSYAILIVAPALLALGPSDGRLLGQLFFVLALFRGPFQLAQGCAPLIAARPDKTPTLIAVGRIVAPIVALVTGLIVAAFGRPVLGAMLGEELVLGESELIIGAALSVLAASNLIVAIACVAKATTSTQVGMWISAALSAMAISVADGRVTVALAAIFAVEMFVHLMLTWPRPSVSSRGEGPVRDGGPIAASGSSRW